MSGPNAAALRRIAPLPGTKPVQCKPRPKALVLRERKLPKVYGRKLWRRVKHGERCFWCDDLLTIYTASRDHVIPRSKGGSNKRSNLVWACRDCNVTKGNKYWPLTMKGHRKTK